MGILSDLWSTLSGKASDAVVSGAQSAITQGAEGGEGVLDKVGGFVGAWRDSGFRGVINWSLNIGQFLDSRIAYGESLEDGVAELSHGNWVGACAAVADAGVKYVVNSCSRWFAELLNAIPIIGGVLKRLWNVLITNPLAAISGTLAQSWVEHEFGDNSKKEVAEVSAPAEGHTAERGAKTEARATTTAPRDVAAATPDATGVDRPATADIAANSKVAAQAESVALNLPKQAIPSVSSDITDGLKEAGNLVNLEAKAPVSEAMAINTLRKTTGGISDVASHATPVLNSGIKVAEKALEVVA